MEPLAPGLPNSRSGALQNDTYNDSCLTLHFGALNQVCSPAPPPHFEFGTHILVKMLLKFTLCAQTPQRSLENI